MTIFYLTIYDMLQISIAQMFINMIVLTPTKNQNQFKSNINLKYIKICKNVTNKNLQKFTANKKLYQTEKIEAKKTIKNLVT